MHKLKKAFFHKSVFLLLLTIITLQLGFFSNFWNIADHNWFQNFQRSSESLIVGRLALSDREGIFYNNGLPGRYYEDNTVISFFENGLPNKFKGDEKFYDQAKYYENPQLEMDPASFESYKTHPSGQGFLFSLLSKISPLDNSYNLQLFKFLTALLMCVVLFFMLLWVSRNHGFYTALVVLFFLMISPWITVFARNLYWVAAVLYLPFIAVLWLLHLESVKKNIHFTFNSMFGIYFFLVLIKCIFSGFELISTALIMSVTPLVYYFIKDKWVIKKLITRLLSAVLGSLSAISVTFFILSYQLSTITGSFSNGLKYILYSYTKRTSGNSGAFPKRYRQSLDSTVTEVLEKYWNGTAIDLNSHISSTWENLLRIEFGELIIAFLVFSLAFLFILKYFKPTIGQSSNTLALLITTWFSVLAPLSWFVIFKGHSYIHTHTNFIAWYMPFCIFGFAIIGGVTEIFSRQLGLYFKSLPKWQLILYSSGFMVLGFVSQLPSIKAYRALKTITQPNNLYAEENGFEIYIHDNEIWFVKEKVVNKSARFFIHIIPDNMNDLPKNRKKYSYDNLAFTYERQHISVPWWKGTFNYLIAKVPLPDYKIQEISTGQYTPKEVLWKANFSISSQ